MKVRVSIEGTSREVEVTGGASGAPIVRVDGVDVGAEVRMVRGGACVVIGGKTYDVVVGGSGEERTVAAGPFRSVALVETGRRRAGGARASRDGAAAMDLKSPMPGRVVKVLCAPGEAVKKGQPLVVVEAMKMENELRAAADATVVAVLVSVGASVDANSVLVTF